MRSQLRRERMVSIAALMAAAPWLGAPGGTPLVVQDAQYHCTMIATDTQFPNGFGAEPAINALGDVVFTALAPDVSSVELRAGDGNLVAGQPETSLVTTTGPTGEFLHIASPVIDDEGWVTFWVREHEPDPLSGVHPTGVYRKRQTAAPTAQSTPVVRDARADPLSPFLDIQEGSSDASTTGMVVFNALRADSTRGVFRGFSASGAAPVAIQYQGGVGLVGPARIHPGRRNWNAFAGTLPSGVGALFVNGSVAESHAGCCSAVSIHGASEPIVSYAQLEEPLSGDMQLVVRRGTNAQVYVDSAVDPVGDFYSNPSVNGYGELAFTSDNTLFVADGETLRRVVCPNIGSLGGIDISSRAINNRGQIAFQRAGFQIMRADPLPGPLGTARPDAASCASLPVGTPCDDGDPESVAYCDGDACIAVVPEPGAIACALAALSSLSRLRRRRA